MDTRVSSSIFHAKLSSLSEDALEATGLRDGDCLTAIQRTVTYLNLKCTKFVFVTLDQPTNQP